jgi:hypothetical protein
MTNEQIAQRAVENAETAAQVEIKDEELRASLIRNFTKELDNQSPPQSATKPPSQPWRYPDPRGPFFKDTR